MITGPGLFWPSELFTTQMYGHSTRQSGINGSKIPDCCSRIYFFVVFAINSACISRKTFREKTDKIIAVVSKKENER